MVVVLTNGSHLLFAAGVESELVENNESTTRTRMCAVGHSQRSWVLPLYFPCSFNTCPLEIMAVKYGRISYGRCISSSRPSGGAPGFCSSDSWGTKDYAKPQAWRLRPQSVYPIESPTGVTASLAMLKRNKQLLFVHGINWNKYEYEKL